MADTFVIFPSVQPVHTRTQSKDQGMSKIFEKPADKVDQVSHELCPRSRMTQPNAG